MRSTESKSRSGRGAAKPRAQIRFRAARLSDFAELLALIQAYYKFDGIEFREQAVASALRKLLRNRSLGRIWIARDRSSPVGYAILTFNYDLEYGGVEGIVTDLYIHLQYRKQGLGRQVLALISAYCRSAGIGAIELQVEERNVDARAFYRTLGFSKLSRIVMSQELLPLSGRRAPSSRA